MGRIVVVPYEKDVLKVLAEEVIKNGAQRDFSEITIILTHKRPKIYLLHHLYKLLKAAFIPPKIVTFDEFITEQALTLEKPPRTLLSKIDQIWILFEIVRKVVKNSAYTKVAGSWEKFYPWGLKLALLIDEVTKEMIESPRDVPYPEGIPEVLSPLIESFSCIYEEYEHFLEKNYFTTQAKRQKLVAEHIQGLKSNLPFFVAGFYALTKSEERILKHFFFGGATFYWQADPECLPSLYQKWGKNWQVEPEVLSKKKHSPKFYFYSASDLHAELEKVRELLPKEVSSPTHTALVLPDPSSLFPAILAIPETLSINISIGYPIEKTLFYSLLECLIAVITSAKSLSEYHFKKLAELCSHPYIRIAFMQEKDDDLTRISDTIVNLISQKEQAKPFYSFSEIETLLANTNIPKSILKAGRDFCYQISSFLAKVQTVNTLASFVYLLMEFIELLLKRLPYSFSITEKEALFHIRFESLPALLDTMVAGQKMDKKAIFFTLLNYLKRERIPFEGEPLEGLQVLGLLETRLLKFKQVIIVDVNEGIVPTIEEIDPILPEPLKRVIGLPEREHKEEIIRYHFERLLNSSDVAHILYQECIYTKSGIEQKKVRSRFIERMIWEKEKEAQTLLEERLVSPISLFIPAIKRQKTLFEKQQADKRAILKFLKTRKLSYSHLNLYLNCPLKFYYRFILNLNPLKELSEEIEAQDIGIIVHKILEDYFKPFLNKSYYCHQFEEKRLEELIKKQLSENALINSYFPKRFFLEETIKFRLKHYLKHHPKKTKIKALELKKDIIINGIAVNTRIDRIDEREEEIIIIDYKTGKIDTKNIVPSTVLDTVLPQDYTEEGLNLLQETIFDLQLPLYIYVYTDGKEALITKTKACYIPLAEMKEGKTEIEHYPFKLKERGEQEAYVFLIKEKLPQVINYLIAHMQKSPYLYPARNRKICKYCEYGLVCEFWQ